MGNSKQLSKTSSTTGHQHSHQRINMKFISISPTLEEFQTVVEENEHRAYYYRKLKKFLPRVCH